MADNLGADLDQPLLEARQRPVPDQFRCRQGAQEVAEIVGECVKLKANCVGGKRAARQAGPLDRALPRSPAICRAQRIAVNGHVARIATTRREGIVVIAP